MQENHDSEKLKRRKKQGLVIWIVLLAIFLGHGIWESRARTHALHYSLSSVGAINSVHFRMERAGYLIFHSEDAAEHQKHIRSCTSALVGAKVRLQKADSSSSGTAYIDKQVLEWFDICDQRVKMWQDYIDGGAAAGRKELLSRYDEKLDYIQQMQDRLALDHDFTPQRIDRARGEF
jgi:limonene-1,2-epoxide hydrolase